MFGGNFSKFEFDPPVQILRFLENGNMEISSEWKANFLIKYSDKNFKISGIWGRGKSGKSFLLNSLAGGGHLSRYFHDFSEIRDNNFKVGEGVSPGTKGLWGWVGEVNENYWMLLDSEGFNSESAILGTLIYFLVDNYIVNSTGVLEEGLLQNFAALIAPTQEIISQYFVKPSLIWVLRDFQFVLENRDGDPCSESEYLNDFLISNCEGREIIKSCFVDKLLVTLIHPFDSEGGEVREGFSRGVENLKKTIFKKSDHSVRGDEFVDILEAVVDALNVKKNSACLFGFLEMQEIDNLENLWIEWYRNVVADFSKKFPCAEEDLEIFLESTREVVYRGLAGERLEFIFPHPHAPQFLSSMGLSNLRRLVKEGCLQMEESARNLNKRCDMEISSSVTREVVEAPFIKGVEMAEVRPSCLGGCLIS